LTPLVLGRLVQGIKPTQQVLTQPLGLGSLIPVFRLGAVEASPVAADAPRADAVCAEAQRKFARCVAVCHSLLQIKLVIVGLDPTIQ